MSALIFRLRQVPETEAAAIRDLLDEHSIEWYETSAGNWGIAMPGIWAANQEQVPQARQLIEHYQQEHTAAQRERHAREKQLGQSSTLTQRVFEYPLRSLGILLFCLFIIYVSTHPFLQMIGYSNQ